METLADWSLTVLTIYGAPALLGLAFIGSLGLPFPVTLVVIAAGAFTRAGLLDGRLALLAGLLGALLADQSEYLVGRLAQPWLTRHWGTTGLWRQAQAALNRYGAWAIVLTRFWLTPLAPAVNVLAGGRYPWLRFLILGGLGQLIWVVMYGGLGYVFAAQWEWISQTAGWVSAWSLALAALALGVVLVRRRPARLAA